MFHGQRSTAVAVTGSLAALLLAAPPPAAALGALAHTGASTDPTGPLVAAVALLAWAVTGWLALTVSVVLLSAVPGLLGRTARALAGRVAPATVRRAVEAALGLTVAVGAITPTTALATPAPGPPGAVVVSTEPAWDLDWPGTTLPRAPVQPVSAPSPPPASAGPVPSAPPPPVRPGATVAPTPAPSASVRPSPVVPAAGEVVVRPGDTLWSIAEASLRSAGTASPTDRQVAQTWPRWWAANREAIGDDADLLLPGTVLRPPGTP